MEMTKEVEVDGFNYLITHPDPDTAWMIGVDLMKIVAEPMSALSGIDKHNVDQILPNAVKILMQKLEPSQTLAIAKKVLSYVELQGEVGKDIKKQQMTDVVRKTHFQGRHGSMLKLVAEVIEFQQEAFFLAVTEAVKKARKMS